MADSATSRMKLRKQSLGSNTNTWGDTKLNDALDTVDRAGKGYESTTLTGSLTLTWTDYSKTNPGQVAVYRLAGSLSSAPTITVPSTEWQWDAIINETGQTLTVKTSAGTGITIPTGYRAAAYCDATDVYYGSPTRFGGNIFAGGQVKNVTNGSDAQDAVTKTQMDTAIAAAGSSVASGLVKVDSLASARFLVSALTASSGATTISDDGDSLGFNTPYGALINGGDKTSDFSAAVNTKYTVDTTGGNIIATLPAAPAKGDRMEFSKYGTNTLTWALNGLKFRGSTTNPTSTAEGVSLWVYTNAARGWVEG